MLRVIHTKAVQFSWVHAVAGVRALKPKPNKLSGSRQVVYIMLNRSRHRSYLGSCMGRVVSVACRPIVKIQHSRRIASYLGLGMALRSGNWSLMRRALTSTTPESTTQSELERTAQGKHNFYKLYNFNCLSKSTNSCATFETGFSNLQAAVRSTWKSVCGQ